MTEIALAVHGGAGKLAGRKTRYPGRRPYELALARALRAGQGILTKGGSSANAVTEAVAVLEDDELFNAGKGAAFCRDGSVELSASIMRGNDLSAGAMVGLKRTKNPVRAARALISHSHGLLFGSPADDYAEARGLEMVTLDYFLTAHRRKQWERMSDKSALGLDHDGHGTVGAVAMDRQGTLAAATSTGGLVNQMPGRVGDTPIVGAGTWADNRSCAVSATGEGDAFARMAFARRVADLIELSQLSIEEAVQRTLCDMEALRGTGGCIVIDSRGNVALPFNTLQMPRGWVVGAGPPQVAILRDEQVVIS